MKTIKFFNKKPVISYEVFPPKIEAQPSTIDATLSGLTALNPSFISVTFGAGGSENSRKTTSIASQIKNQHKIESVAHLPCINLSKQQALDFIEALKKSNIENILALRGDSTQNVTPNGTFRYASDLVSFIKENSNLNIIGACYPESHNEASNFEIDIENLKTKVHAGTDHLITQMFFDNEYFYSFKNRLISEGIDVPLQAGIMPIISKKQILRMSSLSGVNLPKKLIYIIDKYEDNPQSLRKAGIEYATNQIIDLLKQGVDGVHIYILNSLNIAQKIHKEITSYVPV